MGRKTRILFVALSIFVTLIGLAIVMHYQSLGRRLGPITPLKPRELELLANHLDGKFVNPPDSITTWFLYDSATYGLHVRMDFAENGSDLPFKASWLMPSNQISPASAAASFLSPVPEFLASAAESWQPLPFLPGDLVYRASGEESGPFASVRWGLVRRQAGTVTFYLIQSGNARAMRGALSATLSAEPVYMGLVPAPGSVCVRTAP